MLRHILEEFSVDRLSIVQWLCFPVQNVPLGMGVEATTFAPLDREAVYRAWTGNKYSQARDTGRDGIKFSAESTLQLY